MKVLLVFLLFLFTGRRGEDIDVGVVLTCGDTIGLGVCFCCSCRDPLREKLLPLFFLLFSILFNTTRNNCSSSHSFSSCLSLSLSSFATILL